MAYVMQNSAWRRYRNPLRVIESLTNTSYRQLLLVWLGMVMIFAFAYFLLSFRGSSNGIIALEGMPALQKFGNALYFSTITSTTVGYGDLVPHGVAKLVAALQSLSGLFVSGIFVAKLVSYRQEITLDRVYRLTFEDVFYNTREGLFIIRKDFDRIIQHVAGGQDIAEHDWENIAIACRHAQTLLEGIPDFYSQNPHLYTIDAKREYLLLDAVCRTLARLQHLLETFDRHALDWRSHRIAAEEITGLHRVIGQYIAPWSTLSPYADDEHQQKFFAELATGMATLDAMMERRG